MMTEIEATKLVGVLLLLGYQAWVHPQGRAGFAVWCETSGLLLQTRTDFDGWLAMRLLDKTADDDLPFVLATPCAVCGGMGKVDMSLDADGSIMSECTNCGGSGDEPTEATDVKS